MKGGIALGLGLAGILASSLPAQAERAIFVGAIIYTSAQSCDENYIGQRFAARYHPANVGDNPAQSGLSQFDATGAVNYTGPGHFKAVLTAVQGTELYNFGGQFAARLRIVSATPPLAQIKPTTNFVSLTGQIENHNNDAGVGGKKCLVGFRAGLTRRIE